MKKLLNRVVMTAMFYGVIACTNSKAPVVEQSEPAGKENELNTEYVEDDTIDVVVRGTSSASGSATFTKTKNRCTHSACHCPGYWGYKHLNGTYEGKCSNWDGNGYHCGHSPSHHGLRNF